MYSAKSSNASGAVAPLPDERPGSIQIRSLEESFRPVEFWAMCRNDPQTSSGRYQDIYGEDSSAVMSKVGWRFVARPITVGIFNSREELVAIAFSTPIRLDLSTTRKRSRHKTPIDGINLSYAVHSAHEGQGYAILASSQAILQAHDKWGHLLDAGFLNIQTRAVNSRSNSLLSRFGTRSDESSFTVHSKSGEPILFVGTRTPWALAEQRAHAYLKDNISTDLDDIDGEDQTCTEDTPS